MSEWAPVLAAFWLFWLLDGVRLPSHAAWAFLAHRAGGAARAWFGHLHAASPSPLGWRSLAPDIPFALSPAGLANRPVGAAGRPAEAPTVAQALRWEDVREVSVARGWLRVNGRRFCAHTPHVNLADLRQLVAMDPAARAARIEWLLQRWLRPAHLRRRRRALLAHTRVAAACNATALALLAALTVYLVGDLAARLPAGWAERLSRTLPLGFGYLGLLHVLALFSLSRLRQRHPWPGTTAKDSPLLVAALFPPQALRLRSLAVEKAQPPQHPLACALAFGRPEVARELAFNVVADLRWPLGAGRDEPLATEIAAWHRARLAPRVQELLARHGIAMAELLAAPAPDGPASCAYCPRCRAQFVAAGGRCPHGVALAPLAPRG